MCILRSRLWIFLCSYLFVCFYLFVQFCCYRSSLENFFNALWSVFWKETKVCFFHKQCVNGDSCCIHVSLLIDWLTLTVPAVLEASSPQPWAVLSPSTVVHHVIVLLLQCIPSVTLGRVGITATVWGKELTVEGRKATPLKALMLWSSFVPYIVSNTIFILPSTIGLLQSEGDWNKSFQTLFCSFWWLLLSNLITLFFLNWEVESGGLGTVTAFFGYYRF